MRERLTGIVAKYKQKYKDELNASGVSPEHTSLDEVLEEISEKMEEADKLHTKTTKEMQKLFNQEMRQLASETGLVALVTGPVFSPRELSTDLKNTDFTCKILVKPRDFVVKHYIYYIYENCKFVFGDSLTIFEIISIFVLKQEF